MLPRFLSRTALWLGVALLAGAAVSSADENQLAGGSSGVRGSSLTIGDLLLGLLRDGITLAPLNAHEAHFTADDSPQLGAVSRLNAEIGRQIASTPLSSSAGAFAFTLDPATGLVTRPTQSFGPVFAERPLTIGDGRFNLGVSYTQYTFDDFDSVSLRDGGMVLVFTHFDTNGDGTNLDPVFEGDIVESIVFMNINTSITTFVATYGVTDAIDLAVAVPRVEIDMQISVDSEVQRLASGEADPTHQFSNGTTRQVSGRDGTASGVGDVTVRAKMRLGADPELQNILGLAIEARVPTGDELNLLGTGEWLVRAMLLGSTGTQTLGAHANLGFSLGTGSLSNEIVYTAGLDWAADPKLTLSADALGRHALEATSVGVGPEEFFFRTSPSSPVESATFSRLSAETDASRHTVGLSLGLKLNVHANFTVTANGLVPLTTEGLRDDFSSLVGVDYSF